MKHLLLLISFVTCSAIAQDNNIAYLKGNAIAINDPSQLSDSIYRALSPFLVVMVGEMHGTREPAQFVVSLAKLFAEKGDSVSVGLEIPSSKMAAFIATRTDSGIYGDKKRDRFGCTHALY